jgi:DNA-binding NarL/FixJ family response regulator
MTLRAHALVADDDAFFRLAMTGLLSLQLGFSKVTEVGSFDDAMEHLGNDGSLTLVLFDLSMPGMTSPANLAAVRECAPATKLIVVSGSTSRRDIIMSLDAGVHGYVPKSLGPTELSRALETVLGGAIFVPPSLADISAERRRAASASKRMQNAPGSDLLKSLTARQIDVLKLLVRGLANRDIAKALGLGEGTVKIHVAALLRSLQVQNRSAAAAIGARLLDSGY